MPSLDADKKVAVYKAVLSILRSGGDMYNLKVADIAREAGMGKGTVYEYFSSKEEILVQSILYSVEDELLSAQAAIAACKSFGEKLDTLLQLIYENRDCQITLVRLLLAQSDAHSALQLKYEKDMQHLLGGLDQLIGDILKAAKAEGLRMVEDGAYQRQAVFSAIGGFAMYTGNTCFYSGALKAAKRHTRRILLKSLENTPEQTA